MDNMDLVKKIENLLKEVIVTKSEGMSLPELERNKKLHIFNLIQSNLKIVFN
jgi:hypothetical protein